MVIFCFRNMSFWKVVEETRRKHPSQGKNSKNLCELQWYLWGLGKSHPRWSIIREGPAGLGHWVLRKRSQVYIPGSWRVHKTPHVSLWDGYCLMQGWATLFFEAKRIFPHYPWKTNMSLMEGEIQAVPVFMVVSEYIGGSQQVHRVLNPVCAEKAKQKPKE